MRLSYRKVASLLVPLLSGAAAAYYTPLSLWLDMKEGLIAFLGLICASLMQVMPMTANFIQADKLNPTDARRLVASLTRQQHYWIGLLSATILTLIIVIISSALKVNLEKSTINLYGFTPSSFACFFIASSLAFVLIKMTGLFSGMLSLHNLRAELVIDAANKLAKQQKEAIISSAGTLNGTLPEGYGKIIDQP